jgi:hypothetical protein
MGLRWADNVVEQSTTTTTGAYQLGGVPSSGEQPGTQTFISALGNGATCYYYAKNTSGTDYEHGLGTVVSGTPNTITRTKVMRSSNGNAAVDWTGKTLNIYCTFPAYIARADSIAVSSAQYYRGLK